MSYTIVDALLGRHVATEATAGEAVSEAARLTELEHQAYFILDNSTGQFVQNVTPAVPYDERYRADGLAFWNAMQNLKTAGKLQNVPNAVISWLMGQREEEYHGE